MVLIIDYICFKKSCYNHYKPGLHNTYGTTVQKTKHVNGYRHVSVFLMEILLQIDQKPTASIF